MKIVENLLAWYGRSARDLPWRRTRDPYAIWVSEIMLQQTQVKTVVPYFDRWMGELPTVARLARAKPEKLHKLWEGLGYYTRVRNMARAAVQIMEKHGGVFPRRYEEILELPGIGRYTAGAISSIAYNEPAPIVDGNVIRVLSRLFALGGDPKQRAVQEKFWAGAEELVKVAASTSPREEVPLPCSALNQSLMELGALICTPREPGCAVCPVARCCTAFRRGETGRYPELGPRVGSTERQYAAFVVRAGDRYLVRQRPEGVVNAHLWEFPNVELSGSPASASRAAKEVLGVVPLSVSPLGKIRHTITRYRITVQVYQAEFATESGNDGVWLPAWRLHRLAFSSAHKQILERYIGDGARPK